MVTTAREFAVSTFGALSKEVLDEMDKKYPGSADRQVEWSQEDYTEYQALMFELKSVLLEHRSEVREANKLLSEKDESSLDFYKSKGFNYTIEDLRNSSPYINALCDIPGVEQTMQKIAAFERAHSDQFGKILGIAG